jgi:hypothetical protein
MSEGQESVLTQGQTPRTQFPPAGSLSGGAEARDHGGTPRSLLAGILLAVAVGFAIRARHTFAADFPLNDGGLCLVMVEAVRDAALAIPPTVGYNDLALPFAYPPLAFVLAAGVANLGVAPLDTLRWLPLAANTLAIAAVAGLAYVGLGSRTGAIIAGVAFAIMPGGFVWQIMGGGLTRSFGFLFAILALAVAYRLVSGSDPRRSVPLLALCAALAAVSHLEMAWFFALGAGCISLAYGRRRQTVLHFGIAAVGAAALASPWWITILIRHGAGPFFAASQTGSFLSLALAEGDPGILLLAAIALASVVGLVLVPDPRFFALGVIGVLFMLDTRSFAWLSAPVLAIALGGYAAAVIDRWEPGRAEPDVSGQPRVRPAFVVVNAVAASMIVAMTLYLNAGVLVGGGVPLAVLSPEERRVMAWIAERTPPGARFAVVTGDAWPTDRSSEWFPVLARRHSVATVQGTEWLPEREFSRRADHHRRLQACGARDGACLESWARESRLQFDRVYVATREPPEACCSALRAALESDPRFVREYTGPGAAVFARAAAAPSP